MPVGLKSSGPLLFPLLKLSSHPLRSGQEEILKDSTGCLLEYTRYDEVARALGCEGLLLEREDQIAETLQKAKVRFASPPATCSHNH